MKSLFCGLFLLASPALAQADLSLYRVEGVTGIATAARATQARDDAFVQAQRQAFETLLARLGAAGAGSDLDDDALGAMVQSFEVEKEHASPGRYTGSFAFQFKPAAVRAHLDKSGASYTEAQARPLVVLPVLESAGRSVLWEENTSWRTAWEKAAARAGLVPVIVPSGDLSDIAVISTAEALEGTADRLTALARKYQAGGVLVAVLRMQAETPDQAASWEIESRRFDFAGRSFDPLHLTLASSTEGKDEDAEALMEQGVTKIVDSIEQRWKEIAREPVVTGPVTRLPVDVPVNSLAAWNEISARLIQIPVVAGASVIAMKRGLVHVELSFRGDLPDLKEELAEQGLLIEQTVPGGWQLREGPPSSALPF